MFFQESVKVDSDMKLGYLQVTIYGEGSCHEVSVGTIMAGLISHEP